MAKGRCRVVWFLCVLAAGCGGPDRADGGRDGGNQGQDGAPGDGGGGGEALACENRSGARLRLVVRNFTDGTTAPVRLRDSQLGVDCLWSRAADGLTRCVPDLDGSRVVRGEVRFLDARCQDIVAELQRPASRPPSRPGYLRVWVPDPGDVCSPPSELFVLSEAIPLRDGATIYERDQDGICQQTAASGALDYVRARAVDPVDLVRLSAGDSDGARLVTSWFDGEDGSRTCADDLVDRELDVYCGSGLAEDGVLRCLPGTGERKFAFSDASCTTGEEAVPVRACSPVAHARELVGNGACGGRSRVSGLEPIAGPAWGPDCQPWSEELDGVPHRREPVVEPVTLAALALERRPAGGRLDRHVLRAQDG